MCLINKHNKIRKMPYLSFASLNAYKNVHVLGYKALNMFKTA